MRPAGDDGAGAGRWRVDADQAAAEAPVLERRVLGRGWVDAPMVNNEPRLDPHGDDDASAELRVERDRRRLTGLHEGRAWRRRRDARVLLVVRHEVFAAADDGRHRALWQRRGPASLEATWRARWRERDVEPGWVEARAVEGADRGPVDADDLDWFRVEDHTDLRGGIDVTVYEHLSVWAGRHLVTLTLRHPHELDVDEAAHAAAAAVGRSLARG